MSIAGEFGAGTPGGTAYSNTIGANVANGGMTPFAKDAASNVTKLAPDSSVVVRVDSPVGADKLTLPVQHMESTEAMSTTDTVRMAPTGTYRTARVSWVNNGASGTEKLNIAANCSNDVSGLVASQSSLQRDYQLTMAGSILLVSPVPITSLNFSSDVSITADTHRLVVTFGA